ncbi:hypothetical protein D9M68_174230 [compost metagenome]
MSLEVEVDVSYERVLFISVEDKETYSVKLDTVSFSFPSRLVRTRFNQPVGSARARATPICLLTLAQLPTLS